MSAIGLSNTSSSGCAFKRFNQLHHWILFGVSKLIVIAARSFEFNDSNGGSVVLA